MIILRYLSYSRNDFDVFHFIAGVNLAWQLLHAKLHPIGAGVWNQETENFTHVGI